METFQGDWNGTCPLEISHGFPIMYIYIYTYNIYICKDPPWIVEFPIKENSIYIIAMFHYQRVMEMRLEKELLLVRSCVLRLPVSEDKQFSASNFTTKSNIYILWGYPFFRFGLAPSRLFPPSQDTQMKCQQCLPPTAAWRWPGGADWQVTLKCFWSKMIGNLDIRVCIYTYYIILYYITKLYIILFYIV